MESRTSATTSDNQPLSMITIDKNGNRDSARPDLLTLRILEASEKKMNLIRKLLTPEQYSSLKASIKERAEDLEDLSSYEAIKLDGKLKNSASLPVDQDIVEDATTKPKRFSKSSVDLRCTLNDLPANLARKREAIEFFFKPANDNQTRINEDVAFELRSSRPVLRGDSNVTNESSLTFGQASSRLLKLFGLGRSSDELELSGERFSSLLKRSINNDLFTNSNLRVFISRLKSDNQLEKFGQLETSSQSESITRADETLFEFLDSNKRTQVSSNPIESAPSKSYKIPSKGLLKETNLGLDISFFEPLRQRHDCNNKIRISFESVRLIEHVLLTEVEKSLLELRSLTDEVVRLKCSIREICISMGDNIREMVDRDSLMPQLNLLTVVLDNMIDCQQRLSKLFSKGEISQSCLHKETNLDDIIQPFMDTVERFISGFEDKQITHYQRLMDKLKEIRQLPLIEVLSFVPVEESLDLNRRIQIVETLNYPTFALNAAGISRNSFKLSLEKENLINLDEIPLKKITFEVPESEQLEVSMLCRKFKYLPLFQTSVCSSVLTIRPNSETVLNLHTDEFKLEFKVEIENSELANGELQKSQVELLFNALFRPNHSLHNRPTMINMILNRFDSDILSSLLEGRKSIKMRNQFVIDPYAIKFDLSVARRDKSRENLLLSRWTREMNHIVYLSAFENSKLLTLHQVKDLSHNNIDKQRLDTSFDSSQETACHKRVEMRRRFAENFLRQLNSKLLEIYNSASLKSSSESPKVQKYDLTSKILDEPRLKLINLSTVARAAYRLKSRKTVNRPLLPRRRARTSKNLLESSIDIEKGLNQVQRPPGISKSLQLVVTVQRATGVPLRFDQNSRQTLNRSVSPFINQPIQPPFNQQLNTIALSPSPPAITLTTPTTYVELIFRRVQVATSLASGTKPIWNETLFLPVTLNHAGNSSENHLDYFDRNTRQLYEENLQLNLYDYNSYMQESYSNASYSDQVTMRVQDQSSSMLLSGTDQNPRSVLMSRQRIERFLLGSLTIPLASLLTKGRIEGTFSLKQPLFLENYQFEPHVTSTQERLSSIEGTSLKLSQQETLVSLFIALDPADFSSGVPRSGKLDGILGTTEREDIFELAGLWQEFMSSHWPYASSAKSAAIMTTSRVPNAGLTSKLTHPRRYIQALALGSDTKYRLVCRLLFAVEPPQSLLNDSHVMRRLARFVSLLSPLKSGYLSSQSLAHSVWFESHQLINQLLGGLEEKAVLLCNYFLYLGKCSALLLGDSIPEGRSVYVLVWNQSDRVLGELNELPLASDEPETDTNAVGLQASVTPTSYHNFLSRLPIIINSRAVQFWSVSTGRSYCIGEQSPLIGVGSVVTVENIYANIQPDAELHKVNFDIRSRQHWVPLFESGVSMSSGAGVEAQPRQSMLGSLQGAGSGASGWRQKRRRVEMLQRSIGKPDLMDYPVGQNPPLAYEPFEDQLCRHLESVIERTIKRHLLTWRPSRPTYFNRTLSRLLASRLATFEKMLYSFASEDAWRAELARIVREEIFLAQLSSSVQRKIVSWPANITYTSMKVLLDSLFASGVHDADFTFDLDNIPTGSNYAQFIVACHVHPYPAETVSIWLYVAAVVDNSGTGNLATAGDNMVDRFTTSLLQQARTGTS